MGKVLIITFLSVVVLGVLVGVGYEVGKLILERQRTRHLSEQMADNGSAKTDIPNANDRGGKEIDFPTSYRTTGMISLPLDGIIEPFEAWYSGEHNMSRIDYYNGKLDLKALA